MSQIHWFFSIAQVKVREATSNDPWGPSTGLMSEIADLSNNPSAFTEIMSIVWRRLNDHGKNWRHIYKSLVLLDFLIKSGSEKVAAHCRENIYSIETLREFQCVEEGRDQGMGVREQAKQMAALLQDEERLKNERTSYIINEFLSKHSSGVGHETRSSTSAARHQLPTESGDARPGSLEEKEKRKGEDILYQLALEESRKEAERLSTQPNNLVIGSSLTTQAVNELISMGQSHFSRILITHSPEKPFTANQRKSPTLNEMRAGSTPTNPPTGGDSPIDVITLSSDEEAEEGDEHLMLTPNRFKQSSGVGHDTRSSTSAARHQLPTEYDEARPGSLGEEEMQMQIAHALSKEEHEREEEKRKGEDVLYQAGAEPQPVQPMARSAFDTPHFNDPWNPAPPTQPTPPLNPSVPTPTANDPWSAPSAPVTASVDPFSASDTPAHNVQNNNLNSDPFSSLSLAPMQPLNGASRMNTKTPETFLGENSTLVNLDNLMGGTAPVASSGWCEGMEDIWAELIREEKEEADRLSTQPNNTVSGSTLSQSALDDLLSLGAQMSIGHEDSWAELASEDQAKLVFMWLSTSGTSWEAMLEEQLENNGPAMRTRSKKRPAASPRSCDEK